MSRRILVFIIIFVQFFFLYSCKSQDEKNREMVAGEWEYKEPNIHTTVKLSKEGTFETQIVLTDDRSELIVNKGGVTGTWNLTGDKFSLDVKTVAKTIEKDVSWKKNETVQYTFESVSIKRLNLKSKGKKLLWKRTIDPVTNEPMNSKDIFIEMKPVAVNLYKDRIRGKERYLCLHYKLQFEDIEGVDYIIATKDEEFTKTYYELHPRIRDAVIMYLSAQTFKEVKTFAKSNRMNKNLQSVLNHYMKNKLKSLEIERIVVASSKEGVDDFIGFKEDEEI